MGWLEDIGAWISNSVFESLIYLWDSLQALFFTIFYLVIVLPLDLIISLIGYPIYYILWWLYEYVVQTAGFVLDFVLTMLSWMPASFAVIYGIGLLILVLYFFYRSFIWLKETLGRWI